MTELLQFSWPVHRAGYELSSGKELGRKKPSEVVLGKKSPGDDLWIVPKKKASDLREPLMLGLSVFRNFVDWKATPEGALQFTEAYGFLFKHNYDDPQGMMVDEWRHRQKNMRSTVLRWENGADVWKMVFDFNAVDLGPLKTRLSVNRPGNGVFVTLEPTSLWSMMWVEFALHISNQSGLRQCELCGDWFPYGTGTGQRSKRRFCSDPCRKTSHVNSKKENANE
jgi:hypothetical protein